VRPALFKRWAPSVQRSAIGLVLHRGGSDNGPIAEPVGEKLAELRFIGDQVVCLRPGRWRGRVLSDIDFSGYFGRSCWPASSRIAASRTRLITSIRKPAARAIATITASRRRAGR
jgi:hypothetical protein